MILQRLLDNETCGTGLKDRVTACRKRLRDNRVARRQATCGREELYDETRSFTPLQEVVASNPPARPVMPPLAGINHSRSFVETESGVSGTLLVCEQKVGMT